MTSVLSRETLMDKGGKAVVGLQPSDDFRFVRLAWEVNSRTIGKKATWVYYAKGGEYNPYWDDIHLLVNWRNDGAEIKNFFDNKGRIRSRPQNINFYFKKGITYPERTTSDFSPRVLPENCIISVTGPGIFCNSEFVDKAYIVGAYSRAFKLVIDAIYGSGDSSVPGSAATHYRTGMLTNLPTPTWDKAKEISNLSDSLIKNAMLMCCGDETTRYFNFNVDCNDTLIRATKKEAIVRCTRWIKMIEEHSLVEKNVMESLFFSESDRKVIDTLIGPHPISYDNILSENDIIKIKELWAISESDLIRNATKKLGARRQLTKKSYAANRRLEIITHTLQKNAKAIVEIVSSKGLLEPNDLYDKSFQVLSFTLGCCFGRWDIHYLINKKDSLDTLNPFAPLPNCSPSTLQNIYGLPAESMEISSNYPLRISWSGIIVDDEGHSEEIIAYVREAMEVIWKDKADDIEQEACEILGVRTLREYFSKSGKFFADHLKCYSKSRRQAPIYWPLSTSSGSYTLWLYYHRLTDQTLYICVNNFVGPKLKQALDDTENLRKKTSRTSQEEKDLEKLSNLATELKDFHAELLRIAKFWKPNLNDGVQITAAPLLKLFQHKPWQKKLKQTWKDLEKGKYDWAHLAYSIWPERVIRTSHKDLSYAIAHDLEDDLWEKIEIGTDRQGNPKTKWVPKKLSENELGQIIHEKMNE